MAKKKERPEKDNTTWTQEDDELLLELAGTLTYDHIGRKLGRSPRAVQKRLEDLGTSDKYILTGMMSATELASYLNRDKGYVIHLIKECKLPAKSSSLTYNKKKKVTYYYIQPEKFWIWAEKNRDKLNFAQIQEGTILPEPDWLEAQRRIDFYKPVTRKKWSQEDKEKVIKLLKAGNSRQEVADIFNRSLKGIDIIIKEYGLGKERRSWSKEDKKVIVELVRDGKTPQEVADKYGVTRTVIYNIYQRNKDKV